MKEWILILNLLGQDQATGEIDWHEAVRLEGLSFQTCIVELVELVAMFETERIQHDVYCTTEELERLGKERKGRK